MVRNEERPCRTNGPAVLVLAPQPFYEDRGTPIALAHLLRALVHHGYEVDLLTFPTGRDLDIPGVRVLRVPNPLRFRRVPIGLSLRKLILNVFLWRAMRRLLRSRRYVAIHAVEDAAFLAVLGRSYSVPIVYDMQSSMPEQLAAKRPFGWRPVAALLGPCERWLLNRVDQVACSAGLASHVRALAPTVGVREWRYPPQAAVVGDRGAELRSELDLPEGVPLIVYAGTFEPYQGIDELLRAVPAVLTSNPDAHFLLVGADGRHRNMATRQARELRITHRVRILERQPRERVPQYLAMADVLVVPRAYGLNVPLKLFDYFGAGKPIVASGDAVMQMAEAPMRLVRVQHSSHALAAGVLKVLNDPSGMFRVSSHDALAEDATQRHGAFLDIVAELYGEVTGRKAAGATASQDTARRVSVVIPARNEQDNIAATISAVRAQGRAGVQLEIIVADDGSTDSTAAIAAAAGARVIRCAGHGGNPGAARNTGAAHASGDPLIFLDADCVPAAGWLAALLEAHDTGAVVVGGALAPSDELGWIALCDYYASSYMVHPWRHAGSVPNHPPANLSVRRAAFFRTGGFTQEGPVADGHEELGWQSELLRSGAAIKFDPEAVALHRNRDGILNLMRRHYRWAYSVLQSKSESPNVRLAGLYRRPYLLIALAFPMAFVHTLFIVSCWLRARRYQAVWTLPVILLARLAYAWGMTVGGLRWLRGASTFTVESVLLR